MAAGWARLHRGATAMGAEAGRQPGLFGLCAACGAELFRWGRLCATRCPDGRLLLRLETGRKECAWLELMPADVVWLAGVLEAAKTAKNGS